MKKLFLAFAVLLLTSSAAVSEGTAKQVDPYHDWLTYYYVAGDNAKVPEFLKWLQESNTLEKFPKGIPSIEGFLSVVFADNAAKADEWAKSATFTGKTKEALDYAIKPAVMPEAKEIKTVGDIDMVWGSFFASGKDVYLQKIVDVLEKNKKLTDDAKANDLTRKNAAASLGSNMTQHEAVDRFLSKESDKRSDEVGTELKAVVAEVRKQREAREFPAHDGEFNAAMFVTDPAIAQKEFANGSAAGVLHFKELKTAKVGDKRTVVIVFAGQQLSPDFLSDVTYDIKLTNPAGKVYNEQKDMEGIKAKVPTRFRIFYNHAAIFLNFSAKDKTGTYKVNVVLKDNIGKKSIPLNTKIVFKK